MTGCDDAYRQWGTGALGHDPLATGVIVLSDGTRCPLSEVPYPHLLPVAVNIPPGQAEYVPTSAFADAGTQWPIVLVVVGLALVAGLAVLLVCDIVRS